jgi:hypothetical protein
VSSGKEKEALIALEKLEEEVDFYE